VSRPAPAAAASALAALLGVEVVALDRALAGAAAAAAVAAVVEEDAWYLFRARVLRERRQRLKSLNKTRVWGRKSEISN